MATVVLDSSNLDSIVKDALGENQTPKPIEATEKPVEAKSDAPATDEASDDLEGEDGITPRQRREFTQSMLKTLGRKHKAQKTAEDFATQQYNERVLAQQRAEAAERQLEKLRTDLQNSKPVPKDEAPTRDKFENEQAYQDALVDWKVEQKFRTREAEAQKAAAAEREREIMANAKSRISKAIELVPDFQEVTGAVDMEVPGHIAGYMQESDMFAELGYHFAKHPQELERVSKLTPAKALVEIGKIEAKLTPFAATPAAESAEKSNGQKPKPTETGSDDSGTAAPQTVTGPSTETVSATSAGPSRPRPPAPIKPLSSGSAAQVEKDFREMDGKEALAHYQKSHGVNLQRRQRH